MKKNKIGNSINIQALSLKFIYPWRPEQQRALDSLCDHIEDKRVHIVAAPGAGKTVIGLEIFNRLRLKTLVISPTTLVRNQWVERLSLFLPVDSGQPDWVSSSLDKPHYFTSTTYQAMYSFDKKLKTKAEGDQLRYQSFRHWLKEHEIGLIILDEAHHLKATWWKVLYELVKDNNEIMIVSLTATPPYDANTTEWSRYQRLCGPIDEEISIPELVKSNSLCPHQDYIWLVKTDDENIELLERHQVRVNRFIQELTTHEELNYLLQHNYWFDENHQLIERDLLIHLDEVIALLRLLKYQRKPLPARLLNLLSLSEDDIKPINTAAWETLLQGFIDGTHYPNAAPVEEFREAFSTLLKNKHYLKYNRVNLDNKQRSLDAFSKTKERIKACFDIALVEIKNRQSWLRLVVLADYIRDETLQLSLSGLDKPTGAYPIFHYFIHHLHVADASNEGIAEKTALLTGRLSIIHKNLLGKLSGLLPANVRLETKTFSEHEDFVICNNSSSYLSAAYTKLLKEGALRIVIGTRALLGEGWDAPHVNALIMATQTGAYVTTNQLRGRVMRVDQDDDLKTASIWHIIATTPKQHFNQLIFQELQKRFRTFAGIHAYQLKIESGTDRLSLSMEDKINDIAEDNTAVSDTSSLKNDVIDKSNTVMAKRLKDDLFNLQARWQNALGQAKQQVFQMGLHQKVNTSSKTFSLNRFMSMLNRRKEAKQGLLRLAVYPLGLFSLVSLALLSVGHFDTRLSLSIIAPISIALWLYLLGMSKQLKQPLPTKDLAKNLAKVVLLALHKSGQIKQELELVAFDKAINVTELDGGVLRFSLNGYSRHDNDLFLTALGQFLEPLELQRYMLSLKEEPAADEIYPIPKILGRKKTDAEIFITAWHEAFPKFKEAKLLNTNSDIGERSLLRASALLRLEEMDSGESLQLIERWE